ncbi:ninjurin-1-like [Dreissena polymorpha]|uniref:Ninjurin-1 n=1 Tax=Dreissena polymorpha TaxID=45954 RepID=A0A9D4HRK3_DREPO|nr:ninjurin-1-like [Dreissena polymorpha]KAH3730512.1 hypothetical protein DPMN_056502 [Dreissena polymorpha]
MDTDKNKRQDKSDVADVVEKGRRMDEEEVDIGFKDLTVATAPNIYVGKRNFIHQLMDVALMMANVSQLKALLVAPRGDYFLLLLSFICLSIVLQVLFTICMLVIWSIEKNLEEKTTRAAYDAPTGNGPVPSTLILNKEDEGRKLLANRLDRFGNVLVLFIIVSNVFVTGFGVEGGRHEGAGDGSGGGSGSLFGTGHAANNTTFQ